MVVFKNTFHLCPHLTQNCGQVLIGQVGNEKKKKFPEFPNVSQCPATNTVCGAEREPLAKSCAFTCLSSPLKLASRGMLCLGSDLGLLLLVLLLTTLRIALVPESKAPCMFLSREKGWFSRDHEYFPYCFPTVGPSS